MINSRGLARQHIDSFNEFLNNSLKSIVDINKSVFFTEFPDLILEFIDIKIHKPTISEQAIEREITPQECRLRDLTYGAPIFVKYRYLNKGTKWMMRSFKIGIMPIMVGSIKCILHNLPFKQLHEKNECPYDHG